ncbi:unnamed protein product [Prorocentrum cordatum]|uniref:Uncharacterized protein n=1 Tax=Prorocentrum cordatum TaxID=2364126 RepID=A0ABN9PXT6_9DINO|nr:unnamed protein product [Polarella glacialis]
MSLSNNLRALDSSGDARALLQKVHGAPAEAVAAACGMRLAAPAPPPGAGGQEQAEADKAFGSGAHALMARARRAPRPGMRYCEPARCCHAAAVRERDVTIKELRRHAGELGERAEAAEAEVRRLRLELAEHQAVGEKHQTMLSLQRAAIHELEALLDQQGAAMEDILRDGASPRGDGASSAELERLAGQAEAVLRPRSTPPRAAGARQPGALALGPSGALEDQAGPAALRRVPPSAALRPRPLGQAPATSRGGLSRASPSAGGNFKHSS